MKKPSILLLSSLIGSILMTLAFVTGAFAYPSGSPAGYTGSPGDGHQCVSCHGGSAATVSGWITTNIPATGYVAGTNYTITATVTGTGKKGFEVSPQDATGTQLGILAAGTNNHLVGGTKYVTQNSSGSSSGTAIYNFTWTAPAAGTGPVTFYGAFCVGKSNTKLSTLMVTEDGAAPLSATASATPGLVCAGQIAQLNVLASGGSGSYTYSWISIPAGFTSSLQNPLASPVVSTQYIAHVSDGTLSFDASTNVTVNQPVTANAGNDTTCSTTVTQVMLNGIASNYSGIMWTTNGSGTFSNATSLISSYLPSVTDKTAGNNITLTLTASPQSPCTSSAINTRIIHFDWPTGIDKSSPLQPGLTISPNPSNGFFTLKVPGFIQETAIVTISDITGRIIVIRTITTTSVQPEKFDISGHPKGLYLVKIQAENQVRVSKVVID